METTTAPTTPTSTPVAPTSSRRSHHAGHIIALVIGCLMVLPGFGMAVGGVTTVAAQSIATDDDGYFRFTPDRAESSGVAVVAADLWLDGEDQVEAPQWLFDMLDVDVRLRAAGAASTDEVFIGIARSADVERYLSDAGYSKVVDMDDHTPVYLEVDGRSPVPAPDEQDFWSVSTSGEGEQEITWNARGGHWSVVVMNADGSSDVASDLEIGVKSGAVTPIAVTLMIVGGITLIGAIALIVYGARGRKETGCTPLAPPTPGPAA